jgi:hypothetical protein
VPSTAVVVSAVVAPVAPPSGSLAVTVSAQPVGSGTVAAPDALAVSRLSVHERLGAMSVSRDEWGRSNSVRVPAASVFAARSVVPPPSGPSRVWERLGGGKSFAAQSSRPREDSRRDGSGARRMAGRLGTRDEPERNDARVGSGVKPAQSASHQRDRTDETSPRRAKRKIRNKARHVRADGQRLLRREVQEPSCTQQAAAFHPTSRKPRDDDDDDDTMEEPTPAKAAGGWIAVPFMAV